MTRKNQIILAFIPFLFFACSDSNEPAPLAVVSFTTSALVETTQQTSLTITAENAERFEIDWGDGTTESKAGISLTHSHAYNVAGNYNVKVTAFNIEDKPVSSTKSIRVGERYLKDITITKFPNFNNGAAWDPASFGSNSFADVYFVIESNSLGALQSGVAENINSDMLPVSWPLGDQKLLITNETVTFALYDREDFGSDTFIASWEANFKTEIFLNTATEGTFSLVNQADDMEIVLSLIVE